MGARTSIHILVVLAAAHCGPDTGSGAVAGAGTGDAQTPATGADGVVAWLATELYKAWHCAPAVHDARAPGAHGKNRICSNDLVSDHAGAGEYPVGASTEKELYDARGASIIGYAVYRHVSAGGGDSYYWYESSGDHAFADGLSGSGRPKESCVSCHATAGPETFGHHFGYTRAGPDG